MKLLNPPSPTSVILRVKLMDSSSTTGAGLTGLTSASSGLRISAIKYGEATGTEYTVAGSTIESITTLGTYETPTATKCRFKEVDATKFPGVYEVHLDDTRYASTKSVILAINGATNLAEAEFEIQTENIAADTRTVSGTTQTAGDIVALVSSIGTSGGAAVNAPVNADNASGGIPGVTVGTTKVGTQTGTYANTYNENLSYHTITHAANAIDWVYRLNGGGGSSPVSLTWIGYLVSANDTITVDVWDHVGGAWDSGVFSIVGQAGTTNVTRLIKLYAKHMGTSGAELGNVYVRFRCTGMTSPVLNTDQLSLQYAITSRSAGYANGQIWVDTNHGSAGTLPFVNGTADNPCLTWADAWTLSASTGIRRFQIVNGSAIQLTASFVGYSIEGENWDLDFNGQDISKSHIMGAELTGTATAPTGKPKLEHCDAIAGLTIPPCYADSLAFEDTLTLGSAGDYIIDNAHSAIAGTSRPTIVFASGDCNLNLRHYSGGIELRGMASGADCSVEGFGNVVINADCANATVVIRGTFTLTNNGTNMTIVDSARWAEDQSIASVTGSVPGVGTPVSLDGGPATLAGMLTKMADNNGGVDFRSVSDSLHALQGVVVAGVPSNVTAASGTIVYGTNISGSYTDTFLNDGVYWVTAPVAVNGLDVTMTFAISSSQPNAVYIDGRWEAHTSRYVNVYAYNWITSSYDLLSDATTRMNHNTADQTYLYTLLPAHRKADGTVQVRFMSTSVTTGDRLYLDQVLVRAVAAGATTAEIADAVYAKMKYSVYGGAIWIDTVNGAAGAVVGVNGMASYPVNNLADAITLAGLVGVKVFNLAPDSAITLTQSFDGYIFNGSGTISLNNQSIADAQFIGTHLIQGVSTGSDAHFEHCQFGVLTVAACHFHNCVFSDTVTFVSSSMYNLIACADGTPAGTSAPTFVFASGVTAAFRDWRGGLVLDYMVAGTEAKVDGQGRLVIGANCTGGDVIYRGFYDQFTDNVPGGFIAAGGTVTGTARFAVDQSSAFATAFWNFGTRTLTSFGTLVTDVRNAVWNSLIEYVDETGATKKTKAYVMLQAIFSTIKQRLKVKP